MKLDKENGETILDSEELLKNLNGWTIEITKRQDKKGKYSRVDKVYILYILQFILVLYFLIMKVTKSIYSI